ncbi:MAG: DNA-binding response regulator [Deltaproteobacteria bacterium]|nr:MAG: DNA-binding response regulator [Deltaproteobacteria bacterium]
MPRLLLIEDHPRLARSLAEGLSGSGYVVDVAPSLSAADARCGRHTYDLAVVDRALPDGDGLSWIRRRRDRGCDMPMLVLSARDAVDDRVEGLEAGADDYMVKPFALRELLARLAVLRRRAEGRAARTVRIGDLVVDFEARAARRSGRRLDLTPREFDVLACLARRAGRVVGRMDLTEEIYGPDAPASNAIDVHVAHLRMKLHREGGPLLHTRRGLGWILEEKP